jgi:hypothetical protein
MHAEHQGNEGNPAQEATKRVTVGFMWLARKFTGELMHEVCSTMKPKVINRSGRSQVRVCSQESDTCIEVDRRMSADQIRQVRLD